MRESDVDNARSERLIQQFIDQELSGEERVRLLVQIGRDPAVRERVIDLERLTLSVKTLPRPMVPDDFVVRVMERARPLSKWRRAIDALWAPRALQWNLARAVAAAAVLVVAVGVAIRLNDEPPSSPAGAAATEPASPNSVLVRLIVLQPDAMTVEIAGDFNGWDPRRTPLEQLSGGAWSVTIPLQPGRYEYMFVVDGHEWVGDPLAAEQNDDGFGSRNAVLDVRLPLEASL
jgi:hypothetical protein